MAYRATANTEQRKQQVHASILKAGKALVSDAGFREIAGLRFIKDGVHGKIHCGG